MTSDLFDNLISGATDGRIDDDNNGTTEAEGTVELVTGDDVDDCGFKLLVSFFFIGKIVFSFIVDSESTTENKQ